MEQLVKVGEHTLAVRSQSENIMEWILRYFQKVHPTSKKDSFDLAVDIIDGYGVPFVDYDVIITKDSKWITYQRADYKLELTHDYRTAKVQVYNEFALKHALTNLYSAFIVHIGWGLLIHSSCIDHQHKAYLFAGHSGAGKSTVSQLSYPRPILSDEATLVKIEKKEIIVFDSPFRSEMTTPYIQQSCHLSKILILNQSSEIKTSLIEKSNAIIDILDKVFFWHHDSSETRKLIKLCKHLIDLVPTYDLYFQKNSAFWELIS